MDWETLLTELENAREALAHARRICTAPTCGTELEEESVLIMARDLAILEAQVIDFRGAAHQKLTRFRAATRMTRGLRP